MKSLWQSFKQLKAWQRGVIVFTLFIGIIIGNSDSSTSESSDSKATPSASPTVSLTPTPTPSESESASPTASASRTPESPLEFRFSALRDLKDLRKDVKDAQQGISEEGLGKFYWNVVEIQFNMTQLETLLPREEYADRWNAKLEILKSAVGKLDTSDENLTITKAKSQLNAILNAIPALESIARSLAN